MGARYLADTNVIIDLVLGRLPLASATWLDTQLAGQQVAISVVTRIELLTKTAPVAEYQLMQAFVQAVDVLPLDEPAIQQTISFRQQYRIKLPDAIIAAGALVHWLPLLTRDVVDFQSINGLVVLNLHNPVQLPAI